MVKLTLRDDAGGTGFAGLESALAAEPGCAGVRLSVNDSHAVLHAPEAAEGTVRAALARLRPDMAILAAGQAIEIYKEVGRPAEVVARFDVAAMSGTHGIGHTRMATESAVTPLGAHPFSTGADQCLAHNGSLSNHNRLRRALMRRGRTFATQNDSEVAAAYLSDRMDAGRDIGGALEDGLDALDGFYTFVVGTARGFGVLRDPIACKPAMMAESDDYVAFGSEYRALAVLPGIDRARVWEPDPATVYSWGH
jgi:glutamate synthase domain-containing protein 1